jgi:hypothetical protein
MGYPMLIQYKDDKSLALCMNSGDIYAGRAFTILRWRIRVKR